MNWRFLRKNYWKREIIFQSDLEGLIGKRPFKTQTTYDAFTNGTSDSEETEKKEEKKKDLESR